MVSPIAIVCGRSLVPHGGELFSVGYQQSTRAQFRTVEPEHPIVRPTAERKALLVRLVVAPDAYRIEPHEGRLVVTGELDRDAAAVAVDRAAELRLVVRDLGHLDVAAVPAGVEISGPMA